MSATYDKNQKPTFVFSNLYQLYRQGQNAKNGPGLTISKGQIIKATDLNSAEAMANVKVQSFNPTAFIGKRIARPEAVSAPVAVARNSALDGLKENLKTLQNLQSRLKFMLQELEELVKE